MTRLWAHARWLTMRLVALVGVIVALTIGISSTPAASATARRADVPARLSDQDFWHLIGQLSEPNGFFDSDNLISNEDNFQLVIPALEKAVAPGGVYIGVGPDQNFTYIAALQPRLAFIPDVRRGNLQVHLMYKAIIEMSADRADFLSRLFSRARPAGVALDAGADELFRVYMAETPDHARYDANLAAIIDRLTKTHGFALDRDDLAGITYVYSSFFSAGPALTFVSSRPGNRYPSYRDLHVTSDANGVNHSYLGSEAQFRRLKAMEQANAIVPLVGNFGGSKTLRAVGAYVKEQGGTVTTFYTSNVEQYLFQDGLWSAFLSNVRALPLDESSTFVRACFTSCGSPRGGRSVTLLDSMTSLLSDAARGRVQSYSDVLAHSHP